MVRQPKIVVVGANALAADQDLLRGIRGSPMEKLDPRFTIIALLSIVAHVAILIAVNRVEIRPPEVMVIEAIPERFAKLIVEKPIPKTEVKKEKGAGTAGPAAETAAAKQSTEKAAQPEVTEAQRQKARQNVAKQVARVEQKIRTVGVLGMLSGSGTTAKGPAVVNVLEAMGTRKEVATDLDAALANMGGIKRTGDISMLEKKLVVKSKDAQVNHKEAIDELMASVRTATTSDLAKAGNIIIQKPEAIEGAASSNAKREPDAINAVVNQHKTSIRMTYEKYLKRDPNLAGKITVRFTITASGSVTGVKVLANTTGSTEFEQEIMRKVRMWSFEAIPEGDVTVSYPFVFSPAS